METLLQINLLVKGDTNHALTAIQTKGLVEAIQKWYIEDVARDAQHREFGSLTFYSITPGKDDC